PPHRATAPAQGGPAPGPLGALVGGPGSGDDYADSVGDFQRNEVALDYNASYVFALAGRLFFANGGQPGTPPTPPPPPPMSPPGTGTGLPGTYFQGTALAGGPLLSRVAAPVGFHRGGRTPPPPRAPTQRPLPPGEPPPRTPPPPPTSSPSAGRARSRPGPTRSTPSTSATTTARACG